jgi:hypothetical protein
MTRHQRVRKVQRAYYRVGAEVVRCNVKRATEALKEWRAAVVDLRAYDALQRGQAHGC